MNPISRAIIQYVSARGRSSRTLVLDRWRRHGGLQRALLSGLVLVLAVACGGGSDGAPGGNGDGGNGNGGGTTPPTYTVGGTLAGLAAAQLVLRNDVNGGTFESLTVSADGEFTFPTSLPSDAAYAVSVVAQPDDPAQDCTVSNGSGTVAASAVTDVSVECVTRPLALSSSIPYDRERNVGTAIAPALTFSTPLDPSTVSTADVTLTSPAGSQVVELDVSGRELTVTPESALLPLTIYRLRVGTAVQGNGSAQLTRPVIVEFTTEGDLPTPERGIHLRSPEVELNPLTQIKYCYYFQTSNTGDLGIRTWQTHFTPHVRSAALILTNRIKELPGTLSAANCGIDGVDQEAWTYAAYMADTQMDFPVDDGNGKPVGQLLPAGQLGYLMIEFFNETNDPVSARVELTGTAYDAGVEFTPAWTYVTYNNSISIPPNSTDSETQTCLVSDQLQFFRMTTHSHKQSVHTYIREGMTNVFESLDFSNPGERTWLTAPYYSFASGQITYQCDYSNPTGRTIESGSSPALDEQCIAVGHVFPATTPLMCFDSLGPFDTW